MSKKETNNGKKGGLLKGKPHYDKNGKPLGGIKAIVTDTNTPVELEGGEVIINKHASKKYWRELSKINQSAGNGVPIKNPNGDFDEDPEEYKDGGNVIQFNANHTPSKIILNYAKKIKSDYPKVWDKGGNIFGNEAFKNLERVSDRGYWLDSEKWMYVKWRSYVARHKQDFRINGVVAMLKWVDKVDKGWSYMKDLIETEIEKKYPKKATKMAKGGITGDVYSIKNTEQFKQIMTTFNELSEQFGVENYFLDPNDNCVVFLVPKSAPKINIIKLRIYVDGLISRGFNIFDTNQNIVIQNDNSEGGKYVYFKLNLSESIEYAKGGNVLTYKNKFNKKYGFDVYESHSLKDIAKITGLKLSSLQDIYDKGIGAYKTNPESVRPNVQSKEQWAMARVYSSIMGGKAAKVDATELKEAKMEQGGTLYLAPNGRPSNLTPEQWKLVRTPEFKAWFGDWEKLALRKINDSGIDEITLSDISKNVSKVVDENGEPKVLYHGTDKEWNIFDLSKIGEGSDLLGKGIYLTENSNVAKFYANKVAQNRFIVGYEEGIFGSENAVYEKDADKKAKKHEVIYKFFLNAKSILDIGNQKADSKIQEIIYDSLFDLYKSEDFAKNTLSRTIDFMRENSEKINGFRGEIIYLIQQYPDSKEAVLNYLRQEYDCISFVPTLDFENFKETYINYVAFKPNQIKLADGTNTTFDSNSDDIRYEEGGLIAPNGKQTNLTPEQYKLVRTPEFKAWFGDWENDHKNASKVVDENGEPLLVWHGTKSDFYIFGEGKNKHILDEYKDDYDYRKKVNYFHRNKEYTETFGSKYGGLEKPFFLNIKNIKLVDEDTIEDIGYWKNIYDDVISNSLDGIYSKSGQYATLLNPNQIKLADGTNTTFDSNNNDIRFENGGELKKGIKEELEHIETAKKLYNKQITPKESAEEIAKDHLKDNPYYYSELSKLSKKMEKGGVLENSNLPFVEQVKPIFWQMNLKQFCDYAKSTNLDTRLEGTNAKLQCEDFYKYVVIKPLLSDSAERNVFLLAIESNRMPYEAVEENIKSVNLWDENNRKIIKIIDYINSYNVTSEIWRIPMELYLQKEYFQKNFTKANAIKWYEKHIYHYAYLNDVALKDMIEKGMVKYTDVIERLREAVGLANLTEQDKKQLMKFNETQSVNTLRGKLNGLLDIIESNEIDTSQFKQVNQVSNDNEAKESPLTSSEISFIETIKPEIEKGLTMNKTKIENIAKTFGILEQNRAKELTELSISILARSIAHNPSMTIDQRYDRLVELYQSQPNLSHRTSQSIMMQQYSTPAPIGYLMGIYCGIDKKGTKYFEPSAGNGLLVSAGYLEDGTLNELDELRNKDLKYLGFKNVTQKDGTIPFTEYEKDFDAVLTNPPFGDIEPTYYGKYKITSMEQLMALRGLDTMKDDGKAAIIIGGHMEYDSEGRLKAGKNRIFFVYLYENYNIEDIININGRELYSRQGTSFNTRLILINGRKKQPNGYFPLNTKKTPSTEPFSKTPIDNFEDLLERVTNQI